jgi:hypothetical protein
VLENEYLIADIAENGRGLAVGRERSLKAVINGWLQVVIVECERVSSKIAKKNGRKWAVVV